MKKSYQLTNEVIKKLKYEYYNSSLSKKVKIKKEHENWRKKYSEILPISNLSHSQKRKARKQFHQQKILTLNH